MSAVSGYDAFISYSHKHDAVLGPELQAELQRFAKPWYRMRALSLDPPVNCGGSFPARFLLAEFDQVSAGMVAWPRASAAACG
jgi:hypothetical protein